MRSWSFAKGHGTRNDFVIIVDRHAMLAPSTDDIRWLCDRREGLGADGVIRAVKAEHVADWSGDPDLWFFDASNADGTPLVTLGNGLRVFVRFLRDEGLLESDDATIATRRGPIRVALEPDGRVRTPFSGIALGSGPIEVSVGGRLLDAQPVLADIGHAVSFVPGDLEELTFEEPRWEPCRVAGAPVEVIDLVREAEPGRLELRSWQPGLGESVSCGTGAVAAVAAAAHRRGSTQAVCTVQPLGGSLEVTLDGEDGYVLGQASIIARGNVFLPDRRA